ncbi:hypothetical protein BDW69DRAFT_161982 [Aspergillus filifer]
MANFEFENTPMAKLQHKVGAYPDGIKFSEIPRIITRGMSTGTLRTNKVLATL